MDWLEKLSGKTLLLVIAVCSAFVGLVVNTEINTFKQRIAFLFGGAACSYFLTPGLSRWLSVSDSDWINVIAFALGVFGMSLVQRLKVYVDSLDIIAVIRARLFPGVKP